MELIVNGHPIYCYTGGKAFDAGKPTAIFLHGVLNDHSVWVLQTRALANHGWNVLAPDLPGHGKSAGDPPDSVEDAADFVQALMEAAGVQTAALIGHSLGSLIALETAAQLGQRVSHLVLVGTASPMKVSPALLEASQNDPEKAIALVNTFSHSTLAPPPSALGPGTWLYGNARALMRRTLASNPRVNVFHAGFKACDSYAGGETAMAKVEAPTLFILGLHDQMTPPKAAQSLVGAAQRGTVVMVSSGHDMMLEAPEAVRAAIQTFLRQ